LRYLDLERAAKFGRTDSLRQEDLMNLHTSNRLAALLSRVEVGPSRPARPERLGLLSRRLRCLCGLAGLGVLAPCPAASAAVRSWAYVLQADAAAFQDLRDAAFGLLVLDYADTDGVPFTAQQVAQLQDGPCGRRPVVAYMSIGEAEDYRFYWQASWLGSPPSWLGPQNPDFPGNYKVRYWDPAWQQYIVPPGQPAGRSYLERIQAAGFDGVYLDIIDAYEFWAVERPGSAADMVAFVSKIAGFARALDPEFLVFPQNGAGLVAEPGYLDVVSGIGAEDTWYEDNSVQDPDHTTEVVPQLRGFRDAGKTVLVIDYVTQQALIDDFYAKAAAERFVAYASVRDLDRLTVNPGHEPACTAAGVPLQSWPASVAIPLLCVGLGFFRVRFRSRSSSPTPTPRVGTRIARKPAGDLGTGLGSKRPSPLIGQCSTPVPPATTHREAAGTGRRPGTRSRAARPRPEVRLRTSARGPRRWPGTP
jgi:cysteinyl-tRNA synthetase